MADPSSDDRHGLLRLLSGEARDLVERHLEPLAFTRGDVLLEHDTPAERVWFVERGLVSLMTPVDEGFVDGICIGAGGVLGLAGALAGGEAVGRAVGRMNGAARGLPVEVLREAMALDRDWRDGLMRHSEAFVAMILQLMACNAVHTVEQRYCRLLLTWRDQVAGDVVPLTQDFAARSLGLDRTSLAPVSRRLQAERAIVVRHGRIVIARPEAILARSCGCYQRLRRRFAASAAGAADPADGPQPAARD